MRARWAVTGMSKCCKKRLGARMLERGVARKIATRLDRHGAGAPALWHGSCLVRQVVGGTDKTNTEPTHYVIYPKRAVIEVRRVARRWCKGGIEK